jgi:hypothetical protein
VVFVGVLLAFFPGEEEAMDDRGHGW